MRSSYDTNEGAKCARETREELGLAPDEPACLVRVVEELVGIPVAVVDLDDFAGAYLECRGKRFIFIRQSDSIPRKRFSLAHELGHHRLGHPPVVETWDQIYAADRPPAERQVNAFAAEFVAPKAEGIPRRGGQVAAAMGQARPQDARSLARTAHGPHTPGVLDRTRGTARLADASRCRGRDARDGVPGSP
jgi:Zn-dependent peptidase ImmA (M78 family)